MYTVLFFDILTPDKTNARFLGVYASTQTNIFCWVNYFHPTHASAVFHFNHLHDLVLQEAGSCCSEPAVLISQGRQVPWVPFQTQVIPGQTWLQAAGLVKAKQLGDVYIRTSLSSRLLKPPKTYIALRDKGE